MADELSLLEHFKDRAYDASLIATYNAFLPFYEDVLLRRLEAKGCLHNVVLMDARQCAASLVNEGLRPRRAGRDYSLLPIRVGGAFHPKIILLVGRQQGVLMVGSHNLTMSGFGLNRELTTKFEYTPSKNKQKDWTTLATFQAAFRFLRGWATDQPEEMHEVLDLFEHHAPWLRELMPADTTMPLLCSGREGRNLWEMVRANLPDNVRRITVVGPYFDSELAFLRQLAREYQPQELIVGIDPQRTKLSRQTRQFLPQAKFVDVGALYPNREYVHAKALFFETTDGQEMLVTGSANPSRTAWLALADRNVEAIVLHSGSKGQTPAKGLGLTALAKQQPLSPEDWAQIGEPLPESDSESPSDRLPLLAVVTEEGFELIVDLSAKSGIDEVRLLNNVAETIGNSSKIVQVQDRIRIEFGMEEAKQLATLLELRAGPSVVGYAIPHRLELLLNRGATDAQRAFQRSLNTLSSASPMLEEVLRIVNKVIFDDLVVTPPEARGIKAEDKGGTEEDGDQFSEFEIGIADTKRAKRRRTFYAEGDLGLILNHLIHKLGTGLYTESELAPQRERSEEELVNSDDEGLVIVRNFDGRSLAQLCRKKVATLLGRMRKQFELVLKTGADPMRPILQLAAILGVLNYLRDRVEMTAWVPRKENLLPTEKLQDFFVDACWYLYSSQSDLLRVVTNRLGNQSCRELSVIRGLLLWLAWESKLNIGRAIKERDGDDEYSRLSGLEQLLHLAPDVLIDNEAIAIAQQAITRSDLIAQYQNWLVTHLAWAEKIVEAVKFPDEVKALSREPEQGDIVRRTGNGLRPLTIVLERENQKVSLGENPEKRYLIEYVRVLDLPAFSIEDAKSDGWSQDQWRRLLSGF